MPRRTRPNLDVILRVPKYEPYSDKRDIDRRGSTSSTTIGGVPVSSSESSNSSTAPTPIASASTTSSAEWNSLLIWARRMRGPQWDSGVGLWMVDEGGEEYYSFCDNPTQNVHSSSSNTHSNHIGMGSTTTNDPTPSVLQQGPIATGTPDTSSTPFEGTTNFSSAAGSGLSTNGHAIATGRPSYINPHSHSHSHPLANEVGTFHTQQQQQQQSHVPL